MSILISYLVGFVLTYAFLCYSDHHKKQRVLIKVNSRDKNSIKRRLDTWA